MLCRSLASLEVRVPRARGLGLAFFRFRVATNTLYLKLRLLLASAFGTFAPEIAHVGRTKHPKVCHLGVLFGLAMRAWCAHVLLPQHIEVQLIDLSSWASSAIGNKRRSLGDFLPSVVQGTVLDGSVVCAPSR